MVEQETQVEFSFQSVFILSEIRIFKYLNFSLKEIFKEKLQLVNYNFVARKSFKVRQLRLGFVYTSSVKRLTLISLSL